MASCLSVTLCPSIVPHNLSDSPHPLCASPHDSDHSLGPCAHSSVTICHIPDQITQAEAQLVFVYVPLEIYSFGFKERALHFYPRSRSYY